LPPEAYVFFDVDDTLIHWRASWREAFARAAQEAGAEVHPAQAEQALTTAFYTFYGDYLRKHAPLGDERAFWLDYNERIFTSLGVAPKANATWAAKRAAELLARPDSIALFPEVPGVLRRLAQSGVRLGIITTRPRAAPDLETLGVLGYFEAVFDGLSTGDVKRVGSPQFARAAEIVAAAQAVGWHVGDSYEDDVLGARAAGLRAVLVDRRGACRETDCQRLESLEPLPDLIGARLTEVER